MPVEDHSDLYMTLVDLDIGQGELNFLTIGIKYSPDVWENDCNILVFNLLRYVLLKIICEICFFFIGAPFFRFSTLVIVLTVIEKYGLQLIWYSFRHCILSFLNTFDDLGSKNQCQKCSCHQYLVWPKLCDLLIFADLLSRLTCKQLYSLNRVIQTTHFEW